MKIVICSSLDFSYQIEKVAKELEEKGHEVIIPKTTGMILDGEISLEQIKKEKENGEIVKRAIKYDVIRLYYNEIKKADAILVLNLDKRGIKNYIGGNVFLEIGFAHVLNKKIFLFNDIPDMYYKTEIKTMQPVILNGNLSKIR
jgi:diphthamide synthase subunit DPH2